MNIVHWYWVQALEYPLQFLPMEIPAWIALIYKIFASAILAYLIVWGFILRPIVDGIRKFFHKDSLVDIDTLDPYTVKERSFQVSLDAADHLHATIEPMIARKEYAKVAEVFVSLNQPADAAKWFLKAGDKMHAAEYLAKAGKTLAAAKMLMKAGDPATAARFYTEKGKHAAAAKAFEKAGDAAGAAQAYATCRKYAKAAQAYITYFQKNNDAQDVRIRLAESCYRMMEEPAARKRIAADAQGAILIALAEVFDAAKHYGLAAHLFREAGDSIRAGEVYLRAGKLEEAAQCLREGGRAQDAEQMMGRYFEAQERWDDAGNAYGRGGDFRRAGDCFARANDRYKAAQCYEHAREFYRAGIGFIQSRCPEDGLRALKQVPEDDPNFDHSRLLIGRCYFELKQYDLCAAALENQLGGKVAQKNLDYFRILADCYGKINRDKDALEILKKIKTISVRSDDIDEQISSIQTRLSRAASNSMPTQASYAPGGAAPSSPEMQVVEKAIGTRFVLERELGRGGMGVVYLARDTQLDRPVALKFLGAMVDASSEFRERFFREAKAAARVTHPNIVAVYDIGADMGKVYIAMEFVDGPSLHRLVQAKGRLAPKTAANIIGQACSALSAVHQAGIVHRDIKPDNLLIAKGGIVKLTDFGLARGETSNLTQVNQILGTPCYMSPEQTLGKALDARTDIYALGLVLHEALTGITYFSSGNVMKRQQDEMPPLPSTYAEDIPQALDAIVMKAVAKDPAQRFQNAQEMMSALRQAISA